MSIRLVVLGLALVASAPLAALGPSPQDVDTAEDSWTWPDKPQNLQVLPKDWPGSRLSAPMNGFSRALGVSCDHCHVGEPGAPLSTYDFASDANPNKETAREMIRMLGSIGEHLRKNEPTGEARVNMWCHTCHAGRPRPMTLGEELASAYNTRGGQAALDRYAELRARYHGRGAYDFGDESTLNKLGYAVLPSDARGAIEIFLLNTRHFPESGNTWDSLAEAYLQAGDEDNAVRYYEKSLEIDPSNGNARDALRRLRQG